MTDGELRRIQLGNAWKLAENCLARIVTVNQMLTIPAAEYVPAIGDTYPVLDRVVADLRLVIADIKNLADSESPDGK